MKSPAWGGDIKAILAGLLPPPQRGYENPLVSLNKAGYLPLITGGGSFGGGELGFPCGCKTWRIEAPEMYQSIFVGYLRGEVCLRRGGNWGTLRIHILFCPNIYQVNLDEALVT